MMDQIHRKCTSFCFNLTFLILHLSWLLFFSLSTQRLSHAVAISMPVKPATSPPRVTHWSTRLTRTAAGSSRRPSPCNASSSTSTRILRSRNWTAGKDGMDGYYVKIETARGGFGCDLKKDEKWGEVFAFGVSASTSLCESCFVYSVNFSPLSSCFSGLNNPIIITQGPPSVPCL